MEQIRLTAPDAGEEILVYVLEETTINQQRYLLVAEEEEGDSDAFILKQTSEDGEELTFEAVEDDLEFEAIVKVFAELIEDADFEM